MAKAKCGNPRERGKQNVFILYRHTAEIIALTLIMTDKNGDYRVATLLATTEKRAFRDNSISGYEKTW